MRDFSIIIISFINFQHNVSHSWLTIHIKLPVYCTIDKAENGYRSLVAALLGLITPPCAKGSTINRFTLRYDSDTKSCCYNTVHVQPYCSYILLLKHSNKAVTQFLLILLHVEIWCMHSNGFYCSYVLQVMHVLID